MNPAHEPWAEWEDEFVMETYPDRQWSIPQIADKLERTPRALEHRAAKLGVQRPRVLDYDAIAHLSKDGLPIRGIAQQLSYSEPAVRYALKVIAREVEHG